MALTFSRTAPTTGVRTRDRTGKLRNGDSDRTVAIAAASSAAFAATSSSAAFAAFASSSAAIAASSAAAFAVASSAAAFAATASSASTGAVFAFSLGGLFALSTRIRRRSGGILRANSTSCAHAHEWGGGQSTCESCAYALHTKVGHFDHTFLTARR